MGNDGRVLQGTPKQIVQAMQYIAFGQETRTLGEYIDWIAEQVRRREGLELVVEGTTDDERAASLIAGMVAGGLVEKV
jgi:hypothetical protein